MRAPIHSEAVQVGISKVLGRCFSAFCLQAKKVILSTAGERRNPSRNATSPQNKGFETLCLYRGMIIQTVSVVANDSKYMVLQDQESAQGLLNMAVKVKQVLVFKEQHGLLFIFAPN